MSLAFLIPTRHRPDSLARTLASVLPAAGRAGAAVVVCDQSPVPAPVPAGVRLIHRPELSGLPAARNALLAATTAEVVCFLDDDVDLAPDFAVALAHLAAGEPEMLGWGPVVETRTRAVRRLHRLVQLGAFRDPRRLVGGPCDRPATALFGCTFAVRRQAAIRVGFDDRRPGYALGEDLDFFVRLHQRERAGSPRLRFASTLHAVHRRDGGDRVDPLARGCAKGAFLRWWAARHGHGNPLTPVHAVLALGAAASGRGHEPAQAQGVWRGWCGLCGPGGGGDHCTSGD